MEGSASQTAGRAGGTTARQSVSRRQEVGLTARIAVRIQHHPSREGLPERLLTQLDGFDDVAVIPDPEPNAPPHAWRTHQQCLVSIPDEATHLLVLQDDALPTSGFAVSLTEGVKTFPETLLLPFVPGFNVHRVAFARARSAGQTFLPFAVRSFVPVVAILYPAAVALGLLQWSEQMPGLRGADDGIVAQYCRKFNVQPRAFVPCICDHDHTVLTIGKGHPRNGPHRRAALL